MKPSIQPLNVLAFNNNINPPKSLTIYNIFTLDDNWSTYRAFCNPRPVEIKEVNKMFSCGQEFRIYHCPNCNQDSVVHFGCNSRLCTHCGKRYTDTWANSIVTKVLEVNHRMFTMSVPDILWPLFEQNRHLLKYYMNIAIEVITEVMTLRLGKQITPGLIVALHTFGKDLNFKPHLHCIVTEGGLNQYGEWVDNTYFPYESFRKKWQYKLLIMLKQKGIISSKMTDMLFKKYPEGFYVNDSDAQYKKDLKKLSKKLTGKKLLKYVARYFRHPAVAESRLLSYDGKNVIFWYETNTGERITKTMNVLNFIKAIVGHIPEPQFKMIRHYGLYARNKSKKVKQVISNFRGCVNKTQTKIIDYISIHCPKCPNCGALMELVFSSKEIAGDLPPPVMEKYNNLVPYIRLSQLSDRVNPITK